MIDDVFCKIITGDLKGDFVYKDEDIVAIKDIHPQAPVHILLMPVKHISGLADADQALLGKLLSVAHKVAEQEGLDAGYRIILNEGENGGKLVPHLHLHLLGGKKLGPKIVAD